jgi:hypothetical protein
MKILSLLKNKKYLENTVLVTTLLAGVLLSITCSKNNSELFLIPFFLFSASKSIARFISVWLTTPISLLFFYYLFRIRPGSKQWHKIISYTGSLIPMLVSSIALFYLLDLNDFLLLFISIHFLKYSILVWDIGATEAWTHLFFLNTRRKSFMNNGAVWLRAIVPLSIILIWTVDMLYHLSKDDIFFEILFIGGLALALFNRFAVDFKNYLISRKLHDESIEIRFYEGSIFYLIGFSLLIILDIQNIGLWFLISMIIVGDNILMRSELSRVPEFGANHEFYSLKPIFFTNTYYFFVPLFYFLVPLSALILGQETILLVFGITILIFNEFKKLYAYFFENIEPKNVKHPYGLFIMNWNTVIWDHDAYHDKINDWQLNNFDVKFIYRSNYLFNNRKIEYSEFVEHSSYDCLIINGDENGINETIVAMEFWFKLPDIIRSLTKSIRIPYKILDIVYNKEPHFYISPGDPRQHFFDNPAPIFDDDQDDYQEQNILDFLLQYLDESSVVRPARLIIDLVEIETIKLNERIKKNVISETGFDLQDIYKYGLTPLLILHRRTHEFSMISTRFLELLNIVEVTVRWLNVFEKKDDFSLEADLQFSFGDEVSKLRSTKFANQVLFKNQNQLNEYKKVLKETFGYEQKENLSFRVIDFLNWVVFIRNKTRGHGSPSRVSYELYEIIEVNLIRLFFSIADYYDPEITVFNDGFYCHQRGMDFNFKKCTDNSVLPEGLERDLSKVYFKIKSRDNWHTSDELKFTKNNIYLLNAIKKGKHEWLCYNTGELIRPDIIFS